MKKIYSSFRENFKFCLKLVTLLIFTALATPSFGQFADATDDHYSEKQEVSSSRQETTWTSSRTTASASNVSVGQRNGNFISLSPSEVNYLPRNDDGSYRVIVPFNFNFYGTQFNSIYINNNGNITFGNGFSGFTAAGFPISTAMIAPFWSDVDTRCSTCGTVSYKVNPHSLIISWENVGFYSTNSSRVNTYQLIISDGTDPILPPGVNVRFNYLDMQWTTGNASGGSGGLGGTPATVGANKGSGGNYVQIGRFNTTGTVFNGATNNSGVDYLDNKTYDFNLSTSENIPPSVSGLPANNRYDLACGEALSQTISFSAPEPNQTMTIQVDKGGLEELGVSISDNGNSSDLALSLPANHACGGTYQLVVTATDNGLPAASTSVTLEIELEPSSLLCQDALIALDTADGAATITPEQLVSPDTDLSAFTNISLSKSTFSCADIGSNRVTLTATDQQGNQTTCEATVTVEDNSAPIAAARNITVQLDSAGTATITAGQIDNGSSDGCGIASFSLDKTSFSCADVGPNVVTLTVRDNNGNESTGTATVTVEDTTAPIAVARDITVQLDSSGVAAITADQINNGSSDICGIALLTVDITEFGCADKGANTVALTVTDNNGNAATAFATVTVEDISAPTISAPAAVSVHTDAGACEATGVVLGTPAFADNCSGTSVRNDAPGSFPLGSTTVTWLATDASGNEATATQLVTVTDNEAPAVYTMNATITLVNGAAAIAVDDIDNGSTDGCGIESRVLSKTSFDCADIGSNVVTLTVTDVNGNVATAEAVVTVEGEIPVPAIEVIPSSDVYTGGVPTTLYLGYGPQSVELAASGGISYSWNAAEGLSSTSVANPSFTPNAAGTYAFTVTAMNEYGCTATESVSITVVDVRCGNGKKNDKVAVCHKGKTICVSANAVPAHLAHGDQLGDCGGSNARMMAQGEAPVEMNSAQFYNHPSAFSNRTTLAFALENDESFSLAVYNLNGALVKTIASGKAEAGQLYKYEMDASGMANGVFIARLVTSSGIQQLRMIHQQ